MIISLINQKGGAGKTTAAINITSSLAEKGNRMLLVDSDPQGSVVQWQSIANNAEFEVLHLPRPLSKRDPKKFFQQYDHTVIDPPPVIEEITRSVIEVSHLAIIPLAPSPLDIWSCRETVELVKKMQKLNGKPIAKILVYRKIPGTRLGREARDAMEAYGLEIFETEISQRIAFVEAMISGLSVLNYAFKSKAAEEIQKLSNEITKVMENRV
ncbi:MAG: ParA family partition ATPase [Desulfatiglandaceae bacterium]